MNLKMSTQDLFKNLFIRLNVQEVGIRWLPEGCILPLLFHKPDETLFSGVIGYLLKNDFIFLSTDELMHIIEGTIALQKKAVWLTFDDGHRQILDNVLPTLERYSIPAVFFIAPVPIESEEGVPWVLLARENRNLLPMPYEQLTSIPEVWRKGIISRIQRADHKKLPRDLVTRSEIEDMARLPFVTIGSHTANHVIMPNCNDAELESEIALSTQTLSEWTGRKIQYFAYPFGSFNGREKRPLQQYGYVLAATTHRSVMDRRTIGKIDPFEVPRIGVHDHGDLAQIIYHITIPCLRHLVKTSGVFL